MRAIIQCISRRILQVALFFGAAFPFLPAPCLGAVIEGIIMSQDGPIEEPLVRAYADFQAFAAGSTAIASRRSEKAGQYRLELPPGSYFLVATGKKGKENLFSFHGLNPLSVSDDYRWLPFFVTPERKTRCGEDKAAGIGGRVFYKGAALREGAVSVYSSRDKHFRGMGLLTNSLTTDGRFRFDLEPGSYVVIARHRFRDTEMGPLGKGDLFCYPSANPISVGTGQSCEIAIDCYPRDGLTDFLAPHAADPRGRREPQRRMASLYQKSLWDIEGVAAPNPRQPSVLAGTVTNLEGAAVPGLYVSAYPTDNFPLFQMHVIRLITNHIARTGPDGSFRLEVAPGEYYLVAREKMGEAPERHELYGLYEGNANHSIKALPGKTTEEAHIVVAPIMP